MLQNKKNIVIGVIVLIVLVIGFLGYQAHNPKGYSVVYLTNNEVYIGKLSTFPRLELNDGYIFQVVKDSTDPAKNSFQLQPLKDALWSPQKLVLTEENVLFYGPLMETSSIAKKLAEQK